MCICEGVLRVPLGRIGIPSDDGGDDQKENENDHEYPCGFVVDVEEVVRVVVKEEKEEKSYDALKCHHRCLAVAPALFVIVVVVVLLGQSEKDDVDGHDGGGDVDGVHDYENVIYLQRNVHDDRIYQNDDEKERENENESCCCVDGHGVEDEGKKKVRRRQMPWPL